MKNAQSISRVKLPGAGPYCPIAAQNFYDPFLLVSIFPPTESGAVIGQFRIVVKMRSNTETFLGLEIWLSPKHRRKYSRLGVGVGAARENLPTVLWNFSAHHFFSVSPFSPKGKGRGTQKGEGTLTHSLDVKCNGRPP